MTPQRAQAEQPGAQQRKRCGLRRSNRGQIRVEPNMLVIHDGGDAILDRTLKYLAVRAAVTEADRRRCAAKAARTAAGISCLPLHGFPEKADRTFAHRYGITGPAQYQLKAV